jgi:hypothetical protein
LLIKCTFGELGLSDEFCTEVIREQDISPIIKSAIVDYYREVFVDIAPFTRFSSRNLSCFDFEMLGNMNLNERLYIMLTRHFGWQDESELSDRLVQISKFHNNSLIAIAQAFSWFPRKLAENRIQGRQTDVGKETLINEQQIMANLSESSRSVDYVLEYQTSVLRLLEMQLDLGLANSELIKATLECIGLVLKTNLNEISGISKSSILCFFKHCRSRTIHRKAHNKLVQQALSLVNTCNTIRKQYQVCSLLKLWAVSEKTGESKSKEWRIALEEIFCIMNFTSVKASLTLSNISKHFLSIIEEVFAEKSEEMHNISRDSSIVGSDSNANVESVRKEVAVLTSQSLPIDIILLENLFKSREEVFKNGQKWSFSATSKVEQDIEYLQELAFDSDIYTQITQTAMAYVNQKFEIIESIKKINIICGREQKRIYRILNHGTSLDVERELFPREASGVLEPQEQFSPGLDKSDVAFQFRQNTDANISYQSLKKAIGDLKRIEADADLKDPATKYKQTEALNWLDKLIRDLAGFLEFHKNTKVYFTITQDLMRSLGYQELILKVLEMPLSFDIHATCIRFLFDFSYMNITNSSVLLPHFENLMNCISAPLGVKLLSAVISGVETQATMSTILQGIINRILTLINADNVSAFLTSGLNTKERSQTSAKNFGCLTSYFELLSNLTVGDFKQPLLRNQSTILSIIINNQTVSRLYESQMFNQVRKTINTDKSSLLAPFYRFYFAVVSLLADLGIGHPECKEQASRVLEQQLLLDYIASKSSVYPFKIVVLKVYHYVLLHLQDLR